MNHATHASILELAAKQNLLRMAPSPLPCVENAHALRMPTNGI